MITMPHPFEIKASDSTDTPDELMITWGDVPQGSIDLALEFLDTGTKEQRLLAVMFAAQIQLDSLMELPDIDTRVDGHIQHARDQPVATWAYDDPCRVYAGTRTGAACPRPKCFAQHHR